MLQASTSAEGCIHDLHTLVSVDPFLAMEAMRAVAQWRYRPLRLDGVPTAVEMTVTVNFTLN